MHRGGLGRCTVLVTAAVAALALIATAALAGPGALTYRGCIANAGADGCTAPANDSLDGAVGVSVSPDGNSVYVASNASDAITSFDRAP
jgi:DNA-binding beta-propeller fold protein YncE